MTLQESELQVEQLCMDVSYGYSSFPMTNNQSTLATTTRVDDRTKEPLTMFEHVEHPNGQALTKRFVPTGSDHAYMGSGDKYVSNKDTSTWDLGSVDTSGVDIGSPCWHWDPGGLSIKDQRYKRVMALMG